ncbi:hypothetical protein HDV00_011069 [Rhizophlyctis rosea]|nr:hypothetical protein HDV00_011069 [Rhizophlyctis rosea]
MRFIQLATALCLVSSTLGAVIPRDHSLGPLITSIKDAAAAFLFDDNEGDHPKHPHHPKKPHHPPHDEKPGDGDSAKTILQVISEDKAFHKLYKLISERETLVTALNSSDADVTLFAPVDSAFWLPPHHPKVPPELITKGLLYHIADKTHLVEDLKDGELIDTGLTLGSLGDRPQKIRVFEHNQHVALNFRSKIIKDDIKASNGIIQAINHVLIPPPNVLKVVAHFPKVFGLLALAVKRAGLGDELEEAKAITLFAPTNRAFKKLGLKKLKYLFSHKGKAELKKILSYHVSTDLVYGTAILEAKEKTLPTVEGHNLDVKVKKADPEHGHKHPVIEINGEAHVIVHDGIAGNGVIHAIDKVLVPKKDDKDDEEDEDEEDDFQTVLDILFEEEDDEAGFAF